MVQVFLIKYAEIAIKGKNRYLFEDALVRQMRSALYKIDGQFKVFKESGRVYVKAEGHFDYDETVDCLQKIFGIVAICPIVQKPKMSFEELKKEVIDHVGAEYPDRNFTFKVFCRRVDKSFPMESNDVNAALGEAILEAFPETKVDVHDPDVKINVELRPTLVNIYSKTIPGQGGMPTGTAGKATLLLSGGIDSPVAGYMIAKRGVTIDAVYFHAPPYTSERAKEKVVDLAKLVSVYTGPIRLHVINFTEIQLYIYDQCPHDELTIIMRRYMMRIAEKIALESGSLGLITGESLGQVASQTIQSLAVTNEVCTLPVYRPLIAFDKEDIVKIAKKINTFETSILPYEDCCTIFVAKHPVTKPIVKAIEKSELNLAEKIDEMVEHALETREIIDVEA